MSLTQSIEALIDRGYLSQALSRLREAGSIPDTLVPARLYLQSHVGDLLKAQASAERLLKKPLDDHAVAICKEIVGRSLLVHGRSREQGMKFIEDARDLAAQKLGPVQRARYACIYVDTLLHRVGIREATDQIAELRKLAMVSGDASSLAITHLLQAEIRIMEGQFGRSERELRIAKDFLERQPSVVLEGRWARASAAQCSLDGRLDIAKEMADHAVYCALESGSRSLRIPALGTLAHVLLLRGETTECEKILNEVSAIARPGGATLIGIDDTRLQLLLARDELEDSERRFSALLERSMHFEQGRSYYGLWYTHTRVRWLLRTKRSREAVALVVEALPFAERLADRNLLERLQLVAAEALGAAGRADEGAALLANTQRANPDPSLGIVAETSRVAGCLTARESPDTARAHFARAIRICRAIGQHTAVADIERCARALPAPPADADAVAAAPSRIIEHGAAVTQLAAHPALLGAELLDLLTHSRTATRAAIVEEDDTGVRRTLTAIPVSDTAVRTPTRACGTPITLGQLRTRSYELFVTPRPGPSASATVSALERLARTAVTLHVLRRDERERATLWPEQSPEEQLGLVCASEAMMELVKTTRRIAPSNVTVLITGETGAGKEVIARALHQASGRSEQTFLPFNCTTVPREMLDSQLFGYRRGSFTGASDEYPGLIRSAEGGTLFLDEIGEMPLDLQPKLLRFLESNEVLPLGETRPVHVNVRVVAATNADLDQLVNEGRFREDLYYRLNVIRLRVPPLRERREEVPLLVQALLEQFGREGQREPIRLSDEAIEFLTLYHWPGNARQLANELRRVSALAEPGALVMPEHLSPEIAASRRETVAPAINGASTLLVRTDQPLSAATEHVERVLIAQALDRFGGNLERTAQHLGLSRKGLFLKRQRLGLA